MHRKSLPFVFCLVLGTALPTAAQTGPTSPIPVDSALTDKARELYIEGSQLFKKGDYVRATASFAAAWGIKKHFSIAANLGDCELRLKHYRDAAEHLAYALREYPPERPAEEKEHLQALLTEAQSKVGTVHAQVEPEGTEVLIDGQELGKAPLQVPVYVDPGEHQIEARYLGRPAVKRPFTIIAGATQTLQLKVPEPPPGPAVPPVTKETSGSYDARTITLLGETGLTAIALGVGIAYKIRYYNADNDAEDIRKQAVDNTFPNGCSPQTESTSETCRRLRDALDRRSDSNKIAAGAFIASGVFAAATVATYFLWPVKEEEKPETSTRLRLSPTVGQEGSGLVIFGRF